MCIKDADGNLIGSKEEILQRSKQYNRKQATRRRGTNRSTYKYGRYRNTERRWNNRSDRKPEELWNPWNKPNDSEKYKILRENIKIRNNKVNRKLSWT